MDIDTYWPHRGGLAKYARRPRLGVLLSLALPLLVYGHACRAEIYKFVDDNGFVTYTNMPRPGAKPQMVIKDAQPDAGKKAAVPATKRKSSSRSSTPDYFPRVDTSTQRKRDDMRRQLLEDELHMERNNLTAAQTAFTTGSRQPGADMKKLLDAVRLHEKNIEMLNKELSHIR